jgi:hypothetical protein
VEILQLPWSSRWLTFHTWTHSAICSLGSSGTRLPILSWTLLYNHFARTEQKTPFPTITLFLCLPIRFLETGSSIMCVFISMGTCLASRCLAVNYSGFQASCYNGNTRRGQLLLPFRKLIMKESDKIQRPIRKYWTIAVKVSSFDICTTDCCGLLTKTEALFPV